MHPLEPVINSAQPLVLIGSSAEDRFPAYSYDAYTRMGKKFYCLDMGDLPVSRGKTSGGTGHRDAVLRAQELGMEVVEIGRCPVLYLDDKRPECKLHELASKLSGLYGKAPRTTAGPKRREML